MISWPDVLPAPTRDYSLGVNHGLVRTQMESGRIRQERGFLDSENEASVVWLFSDAQYQLFDSWVYHALNGGADWFECPIVSGGGVTTHQVRIQGGTYKPQLQPGVAWRVSAVLDLDAVNRKTEAEVFEEVIGVNLIDFSNQVVEIVNDYYSE